MNGFKIFAVLLVLLLSACSDESNTSADKSAPPASGDHVWTTQTEALEKARQMAAQVEEAAAQRKREIDRQTQ